MNAFVILAVAAAVALGVNLFLKASPAAVADTVRRTGAWLLFGVAVLLSLRGQFVLALPVAALAFMALGKSKPFGSMLGGRRRKDRRAAIAGPDRYARDGT